MIKITDDYDSLINCTDNKNGDTNIIIKLLLLSIRFGVLLLSLISSNIWMTSKPSLSENI